MRYYLDTEFDGHDGALLSLALVRDEFDNIYIRTNETATDPWVLANVIPLMARHAAEWTSTLHLNEVGTKIRQFIGKDQEPVIVADSPVDIGRFCRALSTGRDGGWASAEYPRMTFEVHNVDCYPTTLPGAVQHNAWWDAMALREKLRALEAVS